MKSVLDQPSQFHSGVRHWRLQRISAIALIPLSLWAVVELVPLPAQDYATALEWIHQPLSVGLLLFLVPTLYLHAALGVQVVLEDYVSDPLRRRLVVVTYAIASVGALATLGALFSAY
jgi:succinate dehydrogenase / fumarate reductase membrane anchor subunit